MYTTILYIACLIPSQTPLSQIDLEIQRDFDLIKEKVEPIRNSRIQLLKQLGNYENSRAAKDFRKSTRINRRDVGVRPVITVLPEGTNMSASAIISADRRYVRITPVPIFSGVTSVETFTFRSR